MQPIETKIFGILNLSPDSFSDGDQYQTLASASAKIESFAAQKIYGVDLGAVSSNPQAAPVKAEHELAKLKPLIEAASKISKDLRISIDSFNPSVQVALQDKVDYINDINGFSEPSIYPQLATGQAKLVVMHAMQKTGKAKVAHFSPEEVLQSICRFFDARLPALIQAKIAPERLILDPGMGFFLSAEPNCSIAVLQNLEFFKRRYGLPIYISTSRKSFLRAITGCSLEQAAVPTVLSEIFAIEQGADYIRTHQPENIYFAKKLQNAIKKKIFYL